MRRAPISLRDIFSRTPCRPQSSIKQPTSKLLATLCNENWVVADPKRSYIIMDQVSRGLSQKSSLHSVLHFSSRHELTYSTAIATRENQWSATKTTDADTCDRSLVWPPSEHVAPITCPEGDFAIIVSKNHTISIITPPDARNSRVKICPSQSCLNGCFMRCHCPQIGFPDTKFVKCNKILNDE